MGKPSAGKDFSSMLKLNKEHLHFGQAPWELFQYLNKNYFTPKLPALVTCPSKRQIIIYIYLPEIQLLRCQGRVNLQLGLSLPTRGRRGGSTGERKIMMFDFLYLILFVLSHLKLSDPFPLCSTCGHKSCHPTLKICYNLNSQKKTKRHLQLIILSKWGKVCVRQKGKANRSNPSLSSCHCPERKLHHHQSPPSSSSPSPSLPSSSSSS